MEFINLGISMVKMRGKAVTVVCDPYSPSPAGLKYQAIDSHLVTQSSDDEDHNSKDKLLGNPVFVQGPGEYEVKGVRVIGLRTDTNAKPNTIYHLVIDGINILHCGLLNRKLDEKEIDDLGGVDVLIVPVGALDTLNPHDVVELITKLEPSIVIPTYYHQAHLNEKRYGKLQDLSLFLKEIGKPDVAPQSKFSITKDKMPEEMQIVVLSTAS